MSEKLVRDKIPEIMRAEGQEPKVRTVTGEEYNRVLVEKLREEVEEFCENPSDEELADVIEVVEKLKEIHVEDHVENIRQRKREQRGGFDEGCVVDF